MSLNLGKITWLWLISSKRKWMLYWRRYRNCLIILMAMPFIHWKFSISTIRKRFSLERIRILPLWNISIRIVESIRVFVCLYAVPWFIVLEISKNFYPIKTIRSRKMKKSKIKIILKRFRRIIKYKVLVLILFNRHLRRKKVRKMKFWKSWKLISLLT